MSVPDETKIYCSRCSVYNMGSECCICKDCMDKLIDELKMKKIKDFGISMAGKYRNQGMLEYCKELKLTLLTENSEMYP